MKNRNKKFLMSLSVLFIGFLISSSSLNTLSTKALVEEKNNNYRIDSFDRSTWKWSITEVVSTESTSYSVFPSIAVDTLGNVHIAWMDVTDYTSSGIDHDIFYKRWDASSSSWTTTEVVSTESTGDSEFPSLAVDTSGNVHIAWHDRTNYAGAESDWDIFYKCWDASTYTWTTTEVVSTESTEESSWLSLAIDTSGNVHIAWEDVTDYAGASWDWDIFYKRWNASTSAWTTTEVVSTESTEDSYSPSLAVDTLGNVHITWHDYTDYASSGTDADIFYKRWDDSSSTWTTTEVVSTESTGGSWNPSLAVDTAGNVHIAWDAPDIFYKCRDAATSTWTTTEVVSTESTSSSHYPSLAVDSAGSVHVAWQDITDYAGAGTDPDIFYKRWDAATSIWTTTEVVSTESTSDIETTSLAVDTSGYVHIAWDDLTDYAGAGTDWDIFYKLFAGPPTTAPELASIVPNPTENDTVNLNWNNVFRATTYYVYRSTSNILSVEGLVPITTVSLSEYVDHLPSEGFYYYVVVANNFAGNSSHSNCQNVEFKLPEITKTTINSLLIFGAFVFLFVVMRTRKKKSKMN